MLNVCFCKSQNEYSFFHTAHYNVVISKLTCCIKNVFVVILFVLFSTKLNRISVIDHNIKIIIGFSSQNGISASV